MNSAQFLKSVYAELEAEGHCEAGYTEQENGLEVYAEKYSFTTFKSCAFGKAIAKAFSKFAKGNK